MNFLGIGWLEILFIVLLALLIFGPKQIGRMGESLRKFFSSGTYKSLRQARDDLKNLPQAIAREANVELKEWEKDVARLTEQEGFGAWEAKEGKAREISGGQPEKENKSTRADPKEREAG